jgi:serine/threonine protein kinase
MQFLDLSPPSHPFRLGATHLIVKLADRSGQMPQSLLVEDVIFDEDRHHHRQGGFADVYRGWKAGESIAIKKPRVLGKADVAHKVDHLFFLMPEKKLNHMQRLCREALVWRQLKHPNVLPFIGLSYSLFPRDFLPCLLAPWMTMGTLNDYVETCHYIPERDIPRLVRIFFD